MNITRLGVALLLAGMIAACGQKGPLVHPDTPKHKKVVPGPRAPAPAAPAPAPAPATPAPTAEPPAPSGPATTPNP
jgi:predicted small lipoprotein YifL